MNERIKLPAQEWLGYDPERGNIHGYTFEQMREFAELIVRECMRMCEVAQVGYLTHGLEKEAAGAYSVKQYIEEYLGVEE
jgi:hypothetical protein